MKSTQYLHLQYPELDDVADGSAFQRALAINMDLLYGPATDWAVNVWQGSSGARAVQYDTSASIARYKIRGRELFAMANILVTATSAVNGIPAITVPVSLTKPSSPASGYGVGYISRSSGTSNTQCGININEITLDSGGTARVFEFDDRPASGAALVSGDRLLLLVTTEIR